MTRAAARASLPRFKLLVSNPIHASSSSWNATRLQPWPDYDLGYEQGVRLVTTRVEFDAVLAYSDAIAQRALHDVCHWQVPHDVSMIGFDGLRVGQFMLPKLTSVGFAWYRVALAALESLIELMDSSHERQGEAMRFAPELIPGGSVKTR